MISKERRYEIAQTLQEIFEGKPIGEAEMDALEDAIGIISPEFVRDMGAELEAGMNDPDAIAFSEAYIKTDGAKALLKKLEEQRKREGGV